ncbi:MAG: SufS family cysteine desulfurase [Motiliproteus sp.]|nr:SufS family cysteine desulfurase [Motiliproteus sp.]MCW9052986.1 SufS family cysteine desulfurase [Motiliproteus sp.]
MSYHFDVDLIRQQFPLISSSGITYLDNAATTQKPQSVLDDVEHFYRSYNANVHRGAHQLSDQATNTYEKARNQIKDFINAPKREEIIWTSGATASINLVAQSFALGHLKPGDEIIISLLEHHSNIVPWQQLAQRCGATLRAIPVTDRGDLDMEAYQRVLGPKTRLVALTQLSNALGTVTPLKRCIALARQAGAVTFVDGAQGIVHLKTDVQDLGCDFYAFSGHKLYAPTGIGVLWGKQALLEELPPYQFGGEMIEWVSIENTVFNRLPFKFEAGTPNIAGAIGLASAVRFLSKIDRNAAAKHEQQLLDDTLDGLSQISGIKLIGKPKQRAAVVSFTLDGYHTYDLATLLNQHQIAIRTGHHCTMPLMERLNLTDGSARVSFALYNNHEDVARLLEALDSLTKGSLHPAPKQISKADKQSTNPIKNALEQCRDWQTRYSLIMKLGKEPSNFPEAQKTEQHRLHGCTSQVWISHQFDATNQQLQFRIESDAKVIRGLSRVLLEALEGLTASEIYNMDLDAYFHQLDLMQHLSASRGNGIRAIIEEIQSVASGCRK